MIWEFLNTGHCKYFKYLNFEMKLGQIHRLELWDIQNTVWKFRWISLIFGCKYFNRRRLAYSPGESADGTSYFVTQIKRTPENLEYAR